jgi:hypothetical protein
MQAATVLVTQSQANPSSVERERLWEPHTNLFDGPQFREL